LKDPSKPTVLLDQLTGSKPSDLPKRQQTVEFNDALSVGNFSVDFKNRDAAQFNSNRQFSSVSDNMIADVFGLLNELKSKVDVLSLGHTDSGRLPNDPARAAAPGPEKKEPTVKVETVAIEQ
jgi:hypothetical protein